MEMGMERPIDFVLDCSFGILRKGAHDVGQLLVFFHSSSSFRVLDSLFSTSSFLNPPGGSLAGFGAFFLVPFLHELDVGV